MSTKGIVNKLVSHPARNFAPIRDALREMRNRALEAGQLASAHEPRPALALAVQMAYHEGREDAYEAAAELLDTAIRSENGGLLVGPDEDA